MDVQKAFDTIDHEILLQKVKAIRFSKGILQLFRSYLSELIYLVNIESKLSDFGKISCWVPQGSILGPLLFLIYVTNMTSGFYPSTFVYSRFFPKIQFLFCLLSSLSLWGFLKYLVSRLLEYEEVLFLTAEVVRKVNRMEHLSRVLDTWRGWVS